MTAAATARTCHHVRPYRVLPYQHPFRQWASYNQIPKTQALMLDLVILKFDALLLALTEHKEND